MDSLNIQLIISIVSAVMVLVLMLSIKLSKNMTSISKAFLICLFFIEVMILGAVFDRLWFLYYGTVNMIFVEQYFFGISLLPVALISTGLLFAKSHINIKIQHVIYLSIIPFITNAILFTNKYHNLFFVKYSFFGQDVDYGPYFKVHAIYSYTLIGIALYLFISFSIKNAGFFSKQSTLIITGAFIPLVVNIMYTFKIVEANQFSTPISLSATMIFFGLAIFKYDFLNVVPIAMQLVVDRISDKFVVIDNNMRIVDYNLPFLYLTGEYIAVSRKENFFSFLERINKSENYEFKEKVKSSIENFKVIVFEHKFILNESMKYFNIEITPIVPKKVNLGTIILFKDITQHKKDLKTITLQHEHMLEQERMASLGALMAGISHNLKTPILSLAGCIAGVEDLIKEYRESIGNPIVTDIDHKSIADDMSKWVSHMKKHTAYVSDAITTIKEQTSSNSKSNNLTFLVEDVISGIMFLMNYELKINKCKLIKQYNIKEEVLILGDKGTLVQIINNLISNAIQAYEKIDNFSIDKFDENKRIIDLIVNEDENNVIFCVKDYGKGIPDNVKDKLFKEMITTKGKDGSGIGLYLSYSKVKGMFNGEMWLNTSLGVYTEFFIKIPKYGNNPVN